MSKKKSSHGILHFLRNPSTVCHTMTHDDEKWAREGQEWLAGVTTAISQAPQSPPTCMYKGVTVVLDGVWQDNPEAIEFRALLNKLTKETTQ